jgi:hypothetical protein
MYYIVSSGLVLTLDLVVIIIKRYDYYEMIPSFDGRNPWLTIWLLQSFDLRVRIRTAETHKDRLRRKETDPGPKIEREKERQGSEKSRGPTLKSDRGASRGVGGYPLGGGGCW